jgi:DNA-binding response OmpR family regulator
VNPRVLLVEDDPTVADVVVRYLQDDGYRVDLESDGQRGFDAAVSNPPDLMILDLMLPGLDGLEVCRRVRALLEVPVIMLTARGEEIDRIIGLDIGADDYIAKPFSPRELVSRVRAVLRRSQSPSVGGASILASGDLRVDVAARTVEKCEEAVALTSREFELLVHLMQHPGRAFRRDELLEAVWGYRYGDASTVTVHIRRLREKVEDDPGVPACISTVWGVGYRWDGS